MSQGISENPILQISSTSMQGCCLVRERIGKCHLFCQPILREKSASLLTRPLSHLSEKISWLWQKDPPTLPPACSVFLLPASFYLEPVCAHFRMNCDAEITERLMESQEDGVNLLAWGRLSHSPLLTF